MAPATSTYGGAGTAEAVVACGRRIRPPNACFVNAIGPVLLPHTKGERVKGAVPVPVLVPKIAAFASMMVAPVLPLRVTISKVHKVLPLCWLAVRLSIVRLSMTATLTEDGALDGLLQFFS